MSHHHTITPDETTENEDKARLVDIGIKIEAWREAHRVPKAQMERRFSQFLRSYRNIERASKGETEEIDLEKNLSAFESIWALLNTPDPKLSEKAYDDFSAAARLRNAFMRTMTKTGPNRVILVVGPTGAGKTKARQVLQSLWKSRVVCVDATKVWRDRPNSLLSAIWHSLGRIGPVGHGRDALDRIVSVLGEERRAILIDEAHYLGPDQLNTITTLVNLTPGEFILLGQPTLWSRLENDRGAYLEARQLTQNRLSRRITLTGIVPNDVELALTRRLPSLGNQKAKAAQLLLQHAGQHGNLAFVRNVIERCEEAAEETSTEVTWETLASAVKDELNER